MLAQCRSSSRLAANYFIARVSVIIAYSIHSIYIISIFNVFIKIKHLFGCKFVKNEFDLNLESITV